MWEGFSGGQGSSGFDTAIIDLKESIALCKGLKERGANFILESTGNPSATLELHMPERGKPDDAYLHFTMAKIIKDNVGLDMWTKHFAGNRNARITFFKHAYTFKNCFYRVV